MSFIKYKNCQLHTNLISKKGVISLLVKTRKNIPNEFLKFLDDTFHIKIEKHYRYVPKETESVNYIMETFKSENIQTQYKCGSYYIDVYFPKYNIAIECDEFGHTERDIKHETTRELYIKNKLKCTFIRYNPDAVNFNIFKILNKIFVIIRDQYI
jgi:very-short-patch-repair endonuclease